MEFFQTGRWSSLEKEEKRLRLIRIGLGIFLSGVVFYMFLGFVPGLSCSYWRHTDDTALRIECYTSSIQGKQEFRSGGRLTFLHTVSIPLELWVTVINRTFQCSEVAHPLNQHSFNYVKYYLNLSESDVSTLVEKERVLHPQDVKSVYYYYGKEFLLDRGKGHYCWPDEGWDDKLITSTKSNPSNCDSWMECILLGVVMRLVAVVSLIYAPAFMYYYRELHKEDYYDSDV